MSIRERTLYPYICRIFKDYGWKCYEQTRVEELEPDLILEYGDTRVVSEVKIDSEVELDKAVAEAYSKACLLKSANSMVLLFPRSVRDISLSDFDKVYRNVPDFHSFSRSGSAR